MDIAQAIAAQITSGDLSDGALLPPERELAGALAEDRRAIGEPARFATTDVAFHNALAEIPRNPIFRALNGARAQ